jgi:Tol biopolymer transport system component
VVGKILAPLPKAGPLLDTLRTKARFTLDEIVLVKLDGAKTAGVTTLKTSGPLRRMMYPRLSPKHPALSFHRFGEHDESASLNVISLDGKSELEVSVNATAAQWSADGRELIFTSPFSGEQSELQTIFHREVVQESGRLMKPSHEPQPDGSLQKVEGRDRVSDAKVIATTLFPASPAIAALPDGRVLFAGLPVTFPMVDSETKPAPLLYLAAADGKSVSVVPTQPGDLPAELACFTVSPDGERVAIVESGTDAVAVLTLATGRVQIISPARPNPGCSCRTMPAWKSNTELTFAAVPEEKKPMLDAMVGGWRTACAQRHLACGVHVRMDARIQIR